MPPEMTEEMPDLNLFMLCERLNKAACRDLPDGFHARTCRRDEFDLWAAFPFDTEQEAKDYHSFMVDYFNAVYADREAEFYRQCRFVCDHQDTPVATCFVWKAYDTISTVHWLKTRKEYEGLGIGRALLSLVMNELEDGDYPVYLHTQPSSYRAIQLYSDFGFKLLTDDRYGNRTNDLGACLPLLEKAMPAEAFRKLQFAKAPEPFRAAVNGSPVDQF